MKETIRKKVVLVGRSGAVDHKAFILSNEVEYNVVKYDDGFEGLKNLLTTEAQPDLMIVDLLAEKINGLHFCHIIKRILSIRSLKIILFSEHSHRNNIIKGIQSGAADYIIDPCSDVLFKDRVMYHLSDSPVVDDPGEKASDSEIPHWQYITFQRKKELENIFLEKINPDGTSEIKKLARDISKKDFSSIHFTNCSEKEFAFAKNASTGDLSRFVESTSYSHDVEVKVENVDYQDEVQTELIKDGALEFTAKKLDVYDVIEPKESVSEEVTEPKRDRLLNHEELVRVAGKNKNLKLLLDINQEVSSSTNHRRVIYNVIDQISNFIENARISIIVPSEDMKFGTVLVANDDKSLENLRVELVNYPEILKCITFGEVVFIQDAKNSDLLKEVKKKIQHLAYSSIIVIPIWNKKKVMAVLSIRGKEGGKAVSYEDVAYCQIIATTTAKTIAGDIFLQKILSKFIPTSEKTTH
jgi:CheY-like chemotaxis protein